MDLSGGPYYYNPITGGISSSVPPALLPITILAGSPASTELTGSCVVEDNSITTELTGNVSSVGLVTSEVSGSFVATSPVTTIITGNVSSVGLVTSEVSGSFVAASPVTATITGNVRPKLQVTNEVSGSFVVASPVTATITGNVRPKAQSQTILGGSVTVKVKLTKELTGKVSVPDIFSADLLTGEVDVSLVKTFMTGSAKVVRPIITEITGTVTNPAIQKVITGTVRVDAGTLTYIKGNINVIAMEMAELTGFIKNYLEYSDFLLTGTIAVNELHKDLNGSFNVDNSDESYHESENSYSDPDMIKQIAEWKRKLSYKEIAWNQRGLIPSWYYGFPWKQDVWYFKDNHEVYSREYFTTYIQIEGVLNQFVINEYDNRFFDKNMINLYESHQVSPFLLFVNRKFVPWSKLDIIRSDRFYTLRIRDRDKDLYIGEVVILKLPYDIIYDEDYNDDAKVNLFSFDTEGYLNMNIAKYHIGTNDKNVRVAYFESKDGLNRLVPADMDIRLFRDNIYPFNGMGMLNYVQSLADSKEFGDNNTYSTQNRGVINIYDRSIGRWLVIWNTRIARSESIAMNFLNHEAAQDAMMNQLVIKGVNDDASYVGTDPLMPKDILHRWWECTHSKDLTYNKNIDNTIKYIFGEDHNKFDPVYEKYKSILIEDYKPGELKPKSGNTYSLPKPVRNGHTTSQPIIFVDGLADPNINYNLHDTGCGTFEFTADASFKNKQVTILFFLGICNGTFVAKKLTNSIDVTDSYIPKEDLVVLTKPSDGYGNFFPINSSMNPTKDKLTLQSSAHLSTPLYLVSKKQFIHKRYPAPTNNYLELGAEFATAYDSSKFLIFHDGYLMNSIDYTVLCPSIMKKHQIKKHAVYFRYKKLSNLNPKYIDVYYCCGMGNRAQSSGDLIIDCRKTRATANGQLRFRVPYPSKSYPREYTSFFCIKNLMYVDKSRYIIDGDDIVFQDNEDKFTIGQDLVFVFPYYRPDWDPDDVIPTTATVDFTRYYCTTANSVTPANTNLSFTIGSRGTIPANSPVYLFMNSTYVSPERYVITSSGATTTIRFPNETIRPKTKLTLMVESDHTSYANNELSMVVHRIPTTQTNQTIYDIPEPLWEDSFYVFYGSMIVSPDRYIVTTDHKIIFNMGDFIEGKWPIMMVFIKNKNENAANTGQGIMHLKTEYMSFNPKTATKSINVPTNYFHNIKLSKSNCIVFMNSTYIDPERYTIVNNVFSMTDGTTIPKGREVLIWFAYEEISYAQKEVEVDIMDVIKFDDRELPIRNGATRYTVPYPNLPFTDTEFFVTIGNRFVTEDEYEVNNGIIEFKDAPNNFRSGHKIRFTFIHNHDFTHIAKSEASYTITTNADQEEIKIPTPYKINVNLKRRMLVIYGGAYLDQSLYMVDNVNRKLAFTNGFVPKKGRDIGFIFFMAGQNTPEYLPQSGYLHLRGVNIDRNYNKEMLMVFVNGRLIPKRDIMNINNTTFKITKDIQSRYDLIVFKHSPLINDFTQLYKDIPLDEWTKVLNRMII